MIKTQRDDGNRVRLTVRDAGVGIDPPSLGKLFDPFYTTKSGGMGIGLSVSRSIVEMHHGRLWAEPNDGPGASFSFSIPLASEPIRNCDRQPCGRAGDNRYQGPMDRCGGMAHAVQGNEPNQENAIRWLRTA